MYSSLKSCNDSHMHNKTSPKLTWKYLPYKTRIPLVTEGQSLLKGSLFPYTVECAIA